MILFEFPTEHAIELARFLNQPAGRSFLQALQSRRPSLKDAATFEEQSLIAREAKGWEGCIEEIDSMSKERPGGEEIQGGHLEMSEPTPDKQKPKE